MSLVNAEAKPITSSQSVPSKETDGDWQWVKEVQEGKVETFDLLVRKYRKRLYAVIYNLTSNKEDASDLTQEAFIKAFRSINRFKGNSSFYTWLYRIGVNATLTYLKKNRFKHFFSFETLDDASEGNEVVDQLASKSETDKPTFMKELQEQLNDALHKLSLKHRTVVVLHEIEGLSHQEIAQIMKTPENTVRTRLHYAKQQLQQYLKEYLA